MEGTVHHQHHCSTRIPYVGSLHRVYGNVLEYLGLSLYLKHVFFSHRAENGAGVIQCPRHLFPT